MKKHHLKIQEQYLWDLRRGVKTFEIRFNDRNYAVGDVMIFNNKYRFEILYVHGGLGLLPGYVTLSVREIK